MNTTLLITGGAGFIGSNFVRYILDKTDFSVVNIDKLTYAGNLENLSDIEENKRYTFVHGDISDTVLMHELFERYDFYGIIHFAAETHVDRSIEDSAPFLETNIIGTHTLLEAARKYNITKYHHVSTDEVYGDLGRGSTNYFTEQTPLSPNCPYAASKASSDLLVQSWHETYGLHTIITRCSNNYGPYQFPEKLIPFFLFRAMNDLPLPLYGDGLNVRDWLYVEDHCEAIFTAFSHGKAGSVWNIGGNNERTNLEIVDMILSFVPKSESEITFVPDRKAHDERYAMDASKIKKELGWAPKHSFEDALPKTIEWYLQNRSWCEQVLSKIHHTQ